VSEGWIRAVWPAPDGIVAGTTLRDSDHELPAEPQWLSQVHGTRVVNGGPLISTLGRRMLMQSFQMSQGVSA